MNTTTAPYKTGDKMRGLFLDERGGTALGPGRVVSCTRRSDNAHNLVADMGTGGVKTYILWNGRSDYVDRGWLADWETGAYSCTEGLGDGWTAER